MGKKKEQAVKKNEPKVSKQLSNLTQRILTGVPLALAAIALVWLGSFWLALLLVAAVFFAYIEFESFLRHKGIQPYRGVALTGAVATVVVAQFWGGPQLTALMTALMMAICIGGVLRYSKRPEPLQDSAGTLMAVAYCGWLPAHAIFLRRLSCSDFKLPDTICWGDLGLGVVGLLLLTCIGTDVGAYACGKLLGKHRLCPGLSPGKTVEGALGGVLTAVALGWGWSALSGLPLHHALILAGVASVLSQFGDLFESALKRDVGVKDASNLLAGHGGALDRMDSFILAIPTFYLYVTWFF